jgi:hypothetical protein
MASNDNVVEEKQEETEPIMILDVNQEELGKNINILHKNVRS